MPDLVTVTGRSFARVSITGSIGIVHEGLKGVRAQSIAVDAKAPGTIYVGTYGEGVWRSTDLGGGWSRLGFPEENVFSLASCPADGALYAGCEPSRLFVSRDRGETWREIASMAEVPSAPSWSFPPKPWTSHVRWIAPNPADEKLLLVGIEAGALLRTEDGGKTWQDHRPGAQRDNHCLAWHPVDHERAYQAGGGGAAFSRDGGNNWEPADLGRKDDYCWAIALHPTDPSCWFISANPGPSKAHSLDRKAEAYIYRWRGDGPWEPLVNGLPSPLASMPYAMAAGQDALYAGLLDGTIYVSRDWGDSWQQLDLSGTLLPGITAMAVAAQ